MRLLAFLLIVFSSFSFAQTWPAKVVRVIVPHPPGGPGDVPPRGIAQRLNSEIAKLLADPAFNARYIASQGLIADSATGASPEAFDNYIKAELVEFERLMKLTGLERR